MRKLLAALLVLPFLVSANVPPGDRVATAYEARATLTQPTLASQLSASVPAVPAALPDAGPVESWRTPTNTLRAHADPLGTRSRRTGAHAYLATMERGRLAFSQALARAHTNVPVTFGNPPPASPT